MSFIPIPSHKYLIPTILRSSEEVYRHYLGFDVRQGMKIKSPLRYDKNPSFTFFVGEGTLRWIDFSTGQTGDCIDFISSLFKIRLNEACDKIYKDLKLQVNHNAPLTNPPVGKTTRKVSVFETYDLPEMDRFSRQFWSQFGITQETLAKYNVTQVKKAVVNGNLVYFYKPLDPMFCYSFDTTCKLYRPMTPESKFLTNSHELQGYRQLEGRGTLVITKSLKDVMCFSEFGIDAIAPQSELAYLEKPLVDSLITRYERVFVMYDYDYAGIVGMNRLKRAYDKKIKPIYFKGKKPAKDLSDCVKLKGKQETWNLIKNLMNC